MKQPPKVKKFHNFPLFVALRDGKNNEIPESVIAVPIFNVKPEGRFTGFGEDKAEGCQLVFWCPICRQKRHHGGYYGQKGKADGHRTSHCQCWPHGYYIREVDL